MSKSKRNKILIIAVTILLTTMLTGCFYQSVKFPTISYDNLKEMQEKWTEYYYFDELPAEMKFKSATISSDEIKRVNVLRKDYPDSFDYYGYTISYEEFDYFEENQNGYRFIYVKSNKYMQVNGLDEKVTEEDITETKTIYIDGVECIFYTVNGDSIRDDRLKYLYYSWKGLFFILDNIHYGIKISEHYSFKTEPEEEIEFRTDEYFLSVAEHAIVNRHKGGKK